MCNYIVKQSIYFIKSCMFELITVNVLQVQGDLRSEINVQDVMGCH